MVAYYLIAAVLTLINLLIMVFTFDNKKVSYYFMMLMFIMALTNGGFLAIAVSDTVEEVMLANKIAYIGGCFALPIMTFLICTVCNYNLKRWQRAVTYFYCFGIYILVITSDYHTLFYKSYGIDKMGDCTILVNEYGFGHDLYNFILYGTVIMQLWLVFHTLLKSHSVSRKNTLILISMVVVNVLAFLIVRIVARDFEIMPALYAIDGIMLLFVHHRVVVYNIEDNVASSLANEEKSGYVLLDNNLNYLGSNKPANEIFSGLSECFVDKPIPDSAGFGIVIDQIKKFGIEKSFSFSNGDKHYECQFDRIRRGGKIHGYIIELIEDTDKWKYMSLISEYNSELEKTVEEQTGVLREQQKTIKDIFIQTVTALGEAVDAKDRYTSGHSKRVAEYSRMIAARMGLDKEEQEEIYRAGLLHDVGKIRIPVEIINKNGKLTDEEYNIIKIHPVTGYHILSGISGSDLMAIAAKYHHERYDGKGYPNGLVGDKIPLAARILGVADSYDAMTSNRSYRNALPQDIVRAEIEKGRGTQFDPEIADVMLRMIDEDTEYTMKQGDMVQRKILTVDDDPMNIKILKRIMKDEPMYEVIPAHSAQEAFDILSKNDIHLIFLDVKMPGMGGLEALKIIREKYSTPIVLMTSDKTIDTSTEFASLGCNDYITKPFLPLLIKEVVHNTTERADAPE